MAFIRPFRAWRYNPGQITDIHKKFSPLFDVVSPEELQELYTIPNNSIHLSVPRSLEEASAKLDEWKENQIIVQDPLPGIYVYYQYFWLYGQSRQMVRKGFICMVRMDDDSHSQEPGIILHENTIAASVRDRTEVLSSTLLNVAPTHGLYEDPSHSLESLMDECMEHPVYEHIDYQGVINKLAIVQNKEEVARFMEALRGKPVYLADGHHRYASSLAFRDAQKKSGNLSADDSIQNYHLIYLTNLYGSDISILPIHRVVYLPEEVDADALLNKLSGQFDILDASRFKTPLYEELNQSGYSFGMSVGERQFLLRLKADVDPVKDNPLDLPAPVKKLAYTLLHYFVFDKVLGMEYGRQTGSEAITYVKDYARAMRIPRENPKALSFITAGLSLKDMLDVCNEGSLMPQKSTYFYPKVICGLVFASINEKENESPFDTCFRLPTPG